jgi:hypothetical protein
MNAISLFDQRSPDLRGIDRVKALDQDLAHDALTRLCALRTLDGASMSGIVMVRHMRHTDKTMAIENLGLCRGLLGVSPRTRARSGLALLALLGTAGLPPQQIEAFETYVRKRGNWGVEAGVLHDYVKHLPESRSYSSAEAALRSLNLHEKDATVLGSGCNGEVKSYTTADGEIAVKRNRDPGIQIAARVKPRPKPQLTLASQTDSARLARTEDAVQHFAISHHIPDLVTPTHVIVENKRLDSAGHALPTRYFVLPAGRHFRNEMQRMLHAERKISRLDASTSTWAVDRTVMPKAGGVEMAKWLDAPAAISQDMQRLIGTRMLHTIAALDQHGYVLGDYKPANAMLDLNQGAVGVVDLGGMTKRARSAAAPGNLIAWTRAYSNPRFGIDARAVVQQDLFGAGLCMLRCGLAGIGRKDLSDQVQDKLTHLAAVTQRAVEGARKARPLNPRRLDEIVARHEKGLRAMLDELPPETLASPLAAMAATVIRKTLDTPRQQPRFDPGNPEQTHLLHAIGRELGIDWTQAHAARSAATTEATA